MEADGSNYVLAGGSVGRERLRVIAAMCLPYTTRLLDRVAIVPGFSALDLGCGGGDVTRLLAARVGPEGRVLAVDADPSILAIAQAELEPEYPQIRFQAGPAEAFSADQPLDLAYSRFLLSHLSEPCAVVERLVQSVRPGGRIAVEDVDFSSLYCHPASSAFERSNAIYRETGRRLGGNPEIGLKLFAMLREAGLRNIEAEVYQPAFHRGPLKMFNVLTHRAIAHRVLAQGAATDAEMSALDDELVRYTEREDTLLSAPRIFQVTGVR